MKLFCTAMVLGYHWCDLPERFGDWNNIARRHRRWSESGVWERIFTYLAEDADNEYAMIDSTIIRAHQHAAGAKGGTGNGVHWAQQGGLSTKIHVTCDALGNPTGFHLTPGQAHDLQGADVLLPDILTCIESFLADKAYDGVMIISGVCQEKKAV